MKVDLELNILLLSFFRSGITDVHHHTLLWYDFEYHIQVCSVLSFLKRESCGMFWLLSFNNLLMRIMYLAAHYSSLLNFTAIEKSIIGIGSVLFIQSTLKGIWIVFSLWLLWRVRHVQFLNASKNFLSWLNSRHTVKHTNVKHTTWWVSTQACTHLCDQT